MDAWQEEIAHVFLLKISSMRILNGFPTSSWLSTKTFWNTTQRWCLAEETRREDESTWLEWVSKLKMWCQEKSIQRLLSFVAQAGNLNLIDLAQLDDLWMEAMLNEIETIENGIVVLIDMSGYCIVVLMFSNVSINIIAFAWSGTRGRWWNGWRPEMSKWHRLKPICFL